MPTKSNAWNKITGIQAIRLAETEKLSHKEWLDIRRKGVGGSDISAIAGVNPFSSAIDVFLQKKGLHDVKPNSKMRWGNLLEPAVADEYSETEGVQINKVKAVLQHPEIPHFLANLDRLIVKNGHELDPSVPSHKNLLENGNGVLEVKTTAWAKAWESNTIPEMYMCQVQWYMHITGLKWAQFAVLISGNDFIKSDPIPYDEKLCKGLAFLADRFWQENVLKNVAPDPDQNPATKDAMKLLYPNVQERTIELNNDLNKLIAKRIELNQSIKTAENQKKAIDSQVLSHMKNNKWGITDKYKVTRVLKSFQNLSNKKVKENYPDVYKACSETSESIYPLYKQKKG